MAIFVPESTVRIGGRIGWLNGLMLGVSIAILLFAIGEASTWGWASWRTTACILLAVVTFIGWVIHSGRTSSPPVDLSLIRGRPVLTNLVAQFSGQAVIALQFVLLAFIVQTSSTLGLGYGLGGDATYTAQITTPSGIASVAMGFVVAYTAERRGARLPAWIGFSLMAAGSIGMAFWHSSFWTTLVAYVLFSFGGGLVNAAISNLVIASAPVRVQAVTAATVNVVGSLGSAVAVQVGFAILSLHILSVVSGAPIYAGIGFTIVYIIAALIAIAGFVSTILMPHGRRPQSKESEAGK